jgi:hypothetical protein
LRSCCFVAAQGEQQQRGSKAARAKQLAPRAQRGTLSNARWKDSVVMALPLALSAARGSGFAAMNFPSSIHNPFTACRPSLS